MNVATQAPVIELDNLVVKLGDRMILKKLTGSFSGRAVGLLGPNGAGKTTLFDCLAGVLPCDSGAVYAHGRLIDASERSTILLAPILKGAQIPP